jgi:hypothetical protein
MNIVIMLLGLLYGLYIPGYQLQRLLFKSKGLEMAMMSVALNSLLIVALAFILTLIGKLFNTKLITPIGVWSALLAVSISLFALEYYLVTSARKE